MLKIQATTAAYSSSIGAVYFLVLPSAPQKWLVLPAGGAFDSIHRIATRSYATFVGPDLRLAVAVVLRFLDC